jgi:hypothetical protein
LYLGDGVIQCRDGQPKPFGDRWESAQPSRKWDLTGFAEVAGWASVKMRLRLSREELSSEDSREIDLPAEDIRLTLLYETLESGIDGLKARSQGYRALVDRLESCEEAVWHAVIRQTPTDQVQTLANLLDEPTPEYPRGQVLGNWAPPESTLTRQYTDDLRQLLASSQTRRKELEQRIQDTRDELSSLERRRAKRGLTSPEPWRSLQARIYRLVRIRDRKIRIPVCTITASRR